MWYVAVFDVLFLKEKDHLHRVRVSYLWLVGKTDLATLTATRELSVIMSLA